MFDLNADPDDVPDLNADPDDVPSGQPKPGVRFGNRLNLPGALPLELWGHIINRVHDEIAMGRWWLAWRMIELNRNPNITPMGSLELVTVKAIFAAENYWLGREQDFWRAQLGSQFPEVGPPTRGRGPDIDSAPISMPQH